ncbi:hypothetical protein PYCC9005_000343 [Savitreella phatthalungensis]
MLSLFLLLDLVLPYGGYAFAAQWFKWQDRRRKSLPTHLNELVISAALWTGLYYLGGYRETWQLLSKGTTLLRTLLQSASLYITLLLYARASEFTVLQTSLDRWRTWRWQMWLIFGLALTAVVIFAVLHVGHALRVEGLFSALAGYLASFLLVPLMAACICIFAADYERRRLHGLHMQLDLDGPAGDGVELLRRTSQESLYDIGSDTDGSEDLEDTASMNQREPPRTPMPFNGSRLSLGRGRTPLASRTHLVDRGSPSNRQLPGDSDHMAETTLNTLPPAPLARSDSAQRRPPSHRQALKLHLHHYQIFLWLALYTRYPTIWSSVASGIVMGAACHGIAAYGCDSVFEWVDDRG